MSSVSLNHSSVSHCHGVISEGKVDHSGNWSAPDIGDRSVESVRKWYLGSHVGVPKDEKGSLAFPVSKNFTEVSQAGCRAAESRAAQAGYEEIAKAAKGLFEACKTKESKAAAEDAFGKFEIIGNKIIID